MSLVVPVFWYAVLFGLVILSTTVISVIRRRPSSETVRAWLYVENVGDGPEEKVVFSYGEPNRKVNRKGEIIYLRRMPKGTRYQRDMYPLPAGTIKRLTGCEMEPGEPPIDVDPDMVFDIALREMLNRQPVYKKVTFKDLSFKGRCLVIIVVLMVCFFFWSFLDQYLFSCVHISIH